MLLPSGWKNVQYLYAFGATNSYRPHQATDALRLRMLNHSNLLPSRLNAE